MVHYKRRGNVLYVFQQPFKLSDFENFLLEVLGRRVDKTPDKYENKQAVWIYIPESTEEAFSLTEKMEEIDQYLERHELVESSVKFDTVEYLREEIGPVLEIFVEWQ